MSAVIPQQPLALRREIRRRMRLAMMTSLGSSKSSSSVSESSGSHGSHGSSGSHGSHGSHGGGGSSPGGSTPTGSSDSLSCDCGYRVHRNSTITGTTTVVIKTWDAINGTVVDVTDPTNRTPDYFFTDTIALGGAWHPPDGLGDNGWWGPPGTHGADFGDIEWDTDDCIFVIHGPYIEGTRNIDISALGTGNTISAVITKSMGDEPPIDPITGQQTLEIITINFTVHGLIPC